MKVKIPADFRMQLMQLKPNEQPSGCRALRVHTRGLPLSDWQALEVRAEDGSDLPQLPFPAALIIPETDQQYTYMAFPNFRTILSYNCANKYAVSVGLMADSIK